MNATPFIGFGYDLRNGPEPGSQLIDERLTANVNLSVVNQSRSTAAITILIIVVALTMTEKIVTTLL